MSLSWHSTLSLSVMWEQIPENAHEDAHDRAVILLVLRRTRLQNFCGFGGPSGSSIGVFTCTEAQGMFLLNHLR